MEFTERVWKVAERTFGPEFYNGTSGIALFLARLHHLTNEKVYRTAAEGGLRQALSRLDDVNPKERVGFYSGWTGIAYVLSELGDILDNHNYNDRCLQLIRILADNQISSHGVDVIAGSAGIIPCLLRFHRRYRDDSFLELAICHGEHLLTSARKRDFGWSWKTLEMPARDNLLGFSHGTAGIAWALVELYHTTAERRFLDAAEHAFNYERYWFNPEQRNWPDLRIFDRSAAMSNSFPPCSLTWCHGAPGIALSRLRAYEILRTDVYRDEAEVALQATAKSLAPAAYPGQGNYSLCHGFAGNAESLIYASLVLDPNYRSGAELIAKQGIEHYEKQNIPWPCGVPGGGENPSLMLGLAGIGYFYLRLHEPEKIPPVVIVSPILDDQEASKRL